jgi:hypothetical protein
VGVVAWRWRKPRFGGHELLHWPGAPAALCGRRGRTRPFTKQHARLHKRGAGGFEFWTLLQQGLGVCNACCHEPGAMATTVLSEGDGPATTTTVHHTACDSTVEGRAVACTSQSHASLGQPTTDCNSKRKEGA